LEKVAGPKRNGPGSIEGRLGRVAADSLSVDESAIRLDASLAEMGVDSLDLVVFMMAVEEEFQVEFTREDQKGLHSLADIAVLLQPKAENCN